MDPLDRFYVALLRNLIPALIAAMCAMTGFAMSLEAGAIGAGIGAVFGRWCGDGCARVWEDG